MLYNTKVAAPETKNLAESPITLKTPLPSKGFPESSPSAVMLASRLLIVMLDRRFAANGMPQKGTLLRDPAVAAIQAVLLAVFIWNPVIQLTIMPKFIRYGAVFELFYRRILGANALLVAH